MKKNNKLWALKIGIFTFFTGMAVSFASEVASSASGIVVAALVVAFLLIVSVLTDGLGVAVAACDMDKLSIAEDKECASYRLAVRLVENAERVNNICNDVIGDVCSVLNGACGAAIVVEAMKYIPEKYGMLVAITVSSLLAALTVGGKASVKSMAMNKSAQIVLYSAKIMTMFGIGVRKGKNGDSKRN